MIILIEPIVNMSLKAGNEFTRESFNSHDQQLTPQYTIFDEAYTLFDLDALSTQHLAPTTKAEKKPVQQDVIPQWRFPKGQRLK